MTGDEKPVISVGKVSSLTLLFKSTYFAWEYILLFR